MPRRCTVCDHASRDEIDRALVAGESFRDIAGRFAGLTPASLHRHRGTHLAAIVRKARESDEAARAGSVLDEVRSLHARTLRILASAEAAGDASTALRALREARGGLELLAKLLGELDEAPTVNVAVGSDWPVLRSTILAALEPFPDARAALSRALAGDADAR